MESHYLPMLRNLLCAALLLLLGAGCSSNSSSFQAPGDSGSLSAKLVWPANAHARSGKVAAKSATGVATVRIVVSAVGMPDLRQDFVAGNSSGQIDGIPSGTGRNVTAQGLNAVGLVLYQGTLSDITIQAGQTTDAGVITMQPVQVVNPPIATEPNDTLADATKIAIGKGPFTGQLESASDVDYYTFASDGGWVDFAVLSAIALSGDESARISLLAADGSTVLASALLRGSDTVLPVKLGISTTAGGIYFLRIDKDPAQSKVLTKDYHVNSVYGTLPSEAEPNDSIATATTISIAAGTFEGQLSSDLDVDFYSFVSQGGAVRLNMLASGTPSSFDTLQVAILDGSGSLLAATTLSAADVEFPIRLGVDTVAGKTYFVRVSQDPAAPKIFSKPYLITPEYSNNAYEMEPNDTLATATPLSSGPAWTGQLSSSTDVDWYRFTASGASASFSVLSDGAITFNQSLLVSIIDLDGSTVLSSAIVKGSDVVVPVVLSASTTPGGVYYLRVVKDPAGLAAFSKAYIVTPKF